MEKKYIIQGKIGRGTYAVVYKCKRKSDGKRMAVKKMAIGDDGIPWYVIRESSVLKSLDHPNITKLNDIFIDDKFIFLVFDLYEMNLLQCIGEKNVELKSIKYHMFQLLTAVSYIHDNNIIHRDLKPDNLMIDENGDLVVIDFGMAYQLRNLDMSDELWAFCCSYKAPEVLLGSKKYSFGADIWMIGCTFYELLTDEVLFYSGSDREALSNIFDILGTPTEENWKGVSKLRYYNKNKFPDQNKNTLEYHLENNLSFEIDDTNEYNDIITLLQNLLVLNPNDRITAKEALKSEYFQDVKYDQ